MQFLTDEEAAAWARGRTLLMPFGDRPERQPRLPSLRCTFPRPAHRLFAFSATIASAIARGDSCLLWITGYGVWPSSENSHLYYRLRESYGDHRLLHEAPGHLCLKHEVDDLTTVLQLALLFGWDAYALPDSDHAAAFCSHDEFVECYARAPAELADIKAALTRMNVEFQA
jgi:hypothetical protein